jgi:hypothetical protein
MRVIPTVKTLTKSREAVRRGLDKTRPQNLNDWLAKKVDARLLTILVEDAKKVLNDLWLKVLERAFVNWD